MLDEELAQVFANVCVYLTVGRPATTVIQRATVFNSHDEGSRFRWEMFQVGSHVDALVMTLKSRMLELLP